MAEHPAGPRNRREPAGSRWRRLALAGGWWLAALAGAAEPAEPRALVGPGATKDELIDAYGWPSGQSKSGTKEVLSYPQGTVILEHGRVETVSFTMKPPWPPPRPRPGATSAGPARPAESGASAWATDFDAAAREARRRNVRMLVAFTDSDWSPPSRQFEEEVADHPDFAGALAGDFVLLRVDSSARTALSPAMREQNTRLRERFGVRTYPTLLFLAAEGELLSTVDLQRPVRGGTFRERVIAAVQEARAALPPAAPAAEVIVAAPAPPPAAPPSGAEAATSGGASSQAVEVTSSLFAARWALVVGLLAGVGGVAVTFWLVWRKWLLPQGTRPELELKQRISDAASGLPTPAELDTWPRERVASLVAAYLEADGQGVERVRPATDKDLILRGAGTGSPQVLIRCAGVEQGTVPVRIVRELLGTLAAERVDQGWLVAPAGFAREARTFAAQHGLRLVDGAELIGRLRDLPPLVLPKLLARIAP